MTSTPDSQQAFIRGILLGRLLFADDPADVETVVANDDAFERLLARGRGAVRDPKHTPPSYIVLKDGTRYTTSIRPPWLTDAEVEDSTPDPQGRRLLDALTREVEASREHPATADLEAMRSAVAVYYGQTDRVAKIAVAEQQFTGTLADDPEPLSEVLQSDEKARRWSERQVRRLLNAYEQLKLPGFRLDHYLATAWLWANAPVQLHELLEAGLPPGMSKDHNGLEVGGRPVQFFPRADPSYYLKMPIGRSSAVIWGAVTAKARQEKADQLRQDALNGGVRPHSFNGLLYRALLRYRIALRLYREVLRLYDEQVIQHFADTPYDQKSIEREVIACEENRVVILASMAHAAYPTVSVPPDFFDVEQYGQWLDMLRQYSRAELRLTVYELETQLTISRQMRELTMKTVDALSGRGVTALEKVAAEMFNGLRLKDALFEPDYVTPTLETIANLLQAEGDAARAATYRQRAADVAVRIAALANRH